MPACISQWISNAENQRLIIGNLILPVVIGVLAFLASHSVSSWRDRKRQSLLGAAVCDSLIEEIKNGIGLMSQTQLALNGTQAPTGKLPRRSWDGMQTISDEVLERLLCLSQDRQNRGFPIREIRIHLKNYFDHMIPNWDQVADAAIQGQPWQNIAQQYLTQGKYLEAAQGVLEMTEDARKLLDQNSTKWFPK